MLSNLRVRNFAIIDEIEVEFSSGMTVLTGETGAGKSILVDALGLVLGERGGSGIVRAGSERAEFSAEFDVSQLPHVAAWLIEQALDSDGECFLRRVISSDGRSRAFVNGNSVPLQTLQQIGEMLLDIHGQHFHQSLGKAAVQRELLDHFADAELLRSATESTFAEWRDLESELRELRAADSDRASRLDLLSFQTQELDALDLQDGEIETLQSDRDRLQNSGRLAEGVSNALTSIFDADNGSAQSMIADACHTLDILSRVDPSLAPILALLRESDILVSEAAENLRRYADSLDMDPAHRDRVEERLDAIHSIARKHRVDAEDLAGLRETLKTQLHDLQTAEERGDELDRRVAAAKVQYLEIAHKLSMRRREAALRFSQQVSAAMADLGMAGGRFVVAIEDNPDREPNRFGIDRIEYLISANPGQEPMPLSKVASGGELSRMSLSIQVIASDGSAIPTMIFDEVDSGVGGGTAEMVGQRLRDLGSARQVLCVTHLPQVASLANHHFRIVKMTDGQSTRTAISSLTRDERVEELARMLGGVELTERTRQHAAEMLEKGNPLRKTKSRKSA